MGACGHAWHDGGVAAACVQVEEERMAQDACLEGAVPLGASVRGRVAAAAAAADVLGGGIRNGHCWKCVGQSSLTQATEKEKI